MHVNTFLEGKLRVRACVCLSVCRAMPCHAMYHKWNSIVDVVHNSFTSQIIAFYELCKLEIFDSMTFPSKFIFCVRIVSGVVTTESKHGKIVTSMIWLNYVILKLNQKRLEYTSKNVCFWFFLLQILLLLDIYSSMLKIDKSRENKQRSY